MDKISYIVGFLVFVLFYCLFFTPSIVSTPHGEAYSCPTPFFIAKESCLTGECLENLIENMCKTYKR